MTQNIAGKPVGKEAASLRTVTDMAGRSVTVPGEIQKVFSTSPAGTAIRIFFNLI